MKWNLKDLFQNENELENFKEKLSIDCKKFSEKFQNKLSSLNENDFKNAIKEYQNLIASISKIQTYAFLVFAKDNTKGSFYAKFEQISNDLQQWLLFFELEFNSLNDEKQNQFINSCPDFAYYLENIKKQKIHQLDLKEEKILLKTSCIGANAFSRLFDETMSRMKFNFKDKILNEEEILSLFHNPDRQIRKEAAQIFSDELQKHQHLLTYIYNMIKTDLKINCELRSYSEAESQRHISNQIEKSSVDALIKACEANTDLSKNYYKKKAEILGLDKLYDYDRYAPIKSENEEFSFEDSKKIVLKTFNEFSPVFENIAKEAFENGWIDAMPNDNKRGGAFSHSGSDDAHPYVLLNHTNQRRDLFTLAHELGHAIHQKLSYKVGYLNSHTPLTTAETASVFCEMLVFDNIKNNLDKKSKIALLAGKIEDIFATLFRQINFTTFERRVHQFEGEISTQELEKIWLEESNKMFGDSVILNDYYKIWWSYIPHFIHSPFYCYAYSYAQLLVLALFGLYKSGKCKNFVEIYTEFLSLGGSKSPKDLVAMFGFDINDDEFWLIGLKQIRNLINELEELL